MDKNVDKMGLGSCIGKTRLNQGTQILVLVSAIESNMMVDVNSIIKRKNLCKKMRGYVTV